MKHIKKALSYSIAGSIGLGIVALLEGCSDQGLPQQGLDSPMGMQDMQQGENFFIVIEQTGVSPDTYKVVEKHPTTGPTRAVLRDTSGTERFLSEEELRKIAEEEAAKVDAGSSRLTQEPVMDSGGMSLGETVLAAAAGSLIGGMLANRLMGNRNFQRAQQQYGGGRPTAGISQPYKSTASGQKPRSGFFGGSSGGTSSSAGTSSYGG